MKHFFLRWCGAVCALLLSTAPALQAQYSNAAAASKKLSELYDQRGYLNGQSISVDGSLSVSDANGIPSYTYPISSFTSSGHPITVTLNYAGSVTYSTYHQYQEFSLNNPVEGSWSKYHKTAPTWLLGVNGFAVQALSFATTFVNDPYYMTKTYADNHLEYTDKAFVWTIDGYDVCNRMNELMPEDGNIHDVIRLLRTDGSILELHNTLSFDNLSGGEKSTNNPDLYRGTYYQHEVNPSAFGRVEFDSTYIPNGSTINDPSLVPRILRYYPGDGLEYTFREFCFPFGLETFTAYSTNQQTGFAIYGGKKAFPTIFYLQSINDETDTVIKFEYARHRPEGQMFIHPDVPDTAVSVSRGRALCTGFTGHTIIYSNNAVSIQALGRTTNLRFATAAGGSAYSDVSTLDTTTNSKIIEYGIDGAPAPTFDKLVSSNRHNCWQGFVTSIVDPEGRETKFTYERYKRTFANLSFPHTTSEYPQRPLKLAFWRMKTVTEPSAEQRITYHGATDTTLTASGGFLNLQSASVQEKLALKYAMNATVHDVKKYDRSNNLLTTQTFDILYQATVDPLARDFTNPPGLYVDGWISMMSQTDNITGQTTTENQHYHVYEFPTHEIGLNLPFTQLYATETQADGEYTYTETHYRKLDTMLIKPYKTFTKVKQGYYGTFIMESAARYEYDTITVRHYPGPDSLLLDRFLGREISEQRTCTLNPADTSQTLLITKTNYLHLPQKDSVMTIRWRGYNKWKAYEEYQRRLPDLVQNGDSTMWAEFMATIAAYDTIEVSTVHRMPALYNLQIREVTTDAAGMILGGEAQRYAAFYRQDDTSAIYRGALLSDSLIGYGGVSVLQNTYTYWGGRTGYHKTQLRTETDAVGAVTRYEYDYPQGTQGSMVCNDNSTRSADLFGRRGINEYESPLKTIHYNRTFALGGTPVTNVLSDAVERTYFDQVAATVDVNGIYSRYDYDKNGRLRTGWLAKDFPGDSLYIEPWTGALEVPMQGFTRYEYMSDTVICNPVGLPPSAMPGPPSGFYVQPDYIRLIAAALPDENPCGSGSGSSLVAPPISNSRHKRKIESPLETAQAKRPFHAERSKRGYFTAAASKEIREAVSLTDAKLRLHLTKILGNCVNLTVRIMRPLMAYMPTQIPHYSDTLLVKTYVLQCDGVWSVPQNGSALTGGSGGSSKYDTPKPLSGSGTNPLPYQLLTVNLNSIADDLLSGPWEIEVSSTTIGGEVEIVNDGSDWQPTLLLEGTFNRVHELADYSIRYEMKDRWADPLEATVWAKLDDSLHTASTVGTGPTPADNSRYTQVKNRFGADYRVLTGLQTKTKDGVTWADSVVTGYSGAGQTLRTTDQLGDTASTVYNAQGEPRYSYNADGTVSETRYTFGTPAALIAGNDQDYYGLVNRVLSIGEDGQVSAQFYDAFGRLRLESSMGTDTNTAVFLGLLKTKYEYDLLGRLTTVVNPEGDTTRYWYDSFGRIKYKYQPDMGYTSYGYDKLGNARFVQTQAQADSAMMTFQEYDDQGRTTLIGEARLGGEPGGGGHGIANPGGGKKESVMGFPPHPTLNLNRLTDQLDPNILHDDNTSGMLTANKTVMLPWLTPLPVFWTTNELEQTMCWPLQHDPKQPIGMLLRHPVAYYNDPGLPLSTAADFEHIARYPQNARTVFNYDDLPPAAGSVWFYFPTRDKWDALAPTGKVRNLKGRQAAIAYRTHAGEPYHYTVFSYDERGRIEALLRYTENLGFDAIYYTYNSLNVPVAVRVADPQRQYTTWYSYDANGYTDSVWTLLSPAGSGLGIANATYPQPQTKPTQPDITYSYNKRWQIDTMSYPPVNTIVSYNYNARRFLDSMVALQNGATRLFSQRLQYDATGQITLQITRHNTQSTDEIQEYSYNEVGWLTGWYRDTNSLWTVFGGVYGYDRVGNRAQSVNYLQDSGAYRWYKYTDPVAKNRLMHSYLTHPSFVDTTKFLYTADGAIRYRWHRSGNGLTTENLTYDNIQGRVKRYARWDGSIGGFGQNQDWRYRYGISGSREQKRLYSTPYSKTWTYYLQGADGKQMAVYKGIEADQNTCGNSPGKVYLWASEYLGYGARATHNLTTRPLDDLNSLKEYKVQDHLGSTRLVIAQGGSVIGRYDYDPFGKVIYQNGTMPRLSWIDREEDDESALTELDARKFDEQFGRFTSTDMCWEQYRSLSPYQYSQNNPLRLKDPSGNADDGINWWEATKGAVAAAVNDASYGIIDFTKSSDHPDFKTGVEAGHLAVAVTAGLGAKSCGGIALAGHGATVVTLGSGAVVSEPVAWTATAGAVYLTGVSAVATANFAKAKAQNSRNTTPVNGNSKSSQKKQHMYEIYEKKTGDVVKTGISGRKLNQNGTSKRANTQVNKFNKREGKPNKYTARVVKKDIRGRKAALKAEKANADRLRNEGNSMKYHTYP